jgi:hypothetical protein
MIKKQMKEQSKFHNFKLTLVSVKEVPSMHKTTAMTLLTL